MAATIRIIPGIQWAADIMTGQRPIPFAEKPKKQAERGDFKSVFEEECRKLEERNGKGHD